MLYTESSLLYLKIYQLKKFEKLAIFLKGIVDGFVKIFEIYFFFLDQTGQENVFVGFFGFGLHNDFGSKCLL